MTRKGHPFTLIFFVFVGIGLLDVLRQPQQLLFHLLLYGAIILSFVLIYRYLTRKRPYHTPPVQGWKQRTTGNNALASGSETGGTFTRTLSRRRKQFTSGKTKLTKRRKTSLRVIEGYKGKKK